MSRVSIADMLSNNDKRQDHAMHRAVWGFEVVRVVIRAELHLVALAMRAVRKVIRQDGDGLKFHSQSRVRTSAEAEQ
jgi:hypothetical protein